MHKFQKKQEQDIKGWGNELEAGNYENELRNIGRRKISMGALPKVGQNSTPVEVKKSAPKLPMFHEQKKGGGVMTAKTSPQKALNSDLKASKDVLTPLKLKLQQMINQEEQLSRLPQDNYEDSEQNEKNRFRKKPSKQPNVYPLMTKKSGIVNHKRAKTRLTEEDQKLKKLFHRYDIDLRNERPPSMLKTQSNKYLKLQTLDMSNSPKNSGVTLEHHRNRSNHNQFKNILSTHETLQSILKAKYSHQQLQTLDKIDKINQRMRQTFLRRDHLYKDKKKIGTKGKECQVAAFNDNMIFNYNNSPNVSRQLPFESPGSKPKKLLQVKTPARYKLVLY